MACGNCSGNHPTNNVGGQIKVIAKVTPYKNPHMQGNANLFLLIGKGSNPPNLPSLSKTKVHPDMEEMNNTLPMKTKHITIVTTGTKDLIEMTVIPILVIIKIKLRVKPDLVTLINQVPKMLSMLT